ncbi:MAG TPA: anti-sigma factor [Casimicrobiaceae bacterium]
MNPLPLTDEDLCAYVDGELAPARASEVEQLVARDAAITARVTEMRQQNSALREALDPWLSDPIPPALVTAARAPRGSDRWRRFAPYFAAAATLLLGIASGWYLRDATLERGGTPTTFARQAALTHALYAADVNRPVEIWAAEEKRLVTWLSRRLGFAVHAPDLNGAGFALVGGRLVAGNERPTALFMYENADKQRLSLQVRKQPPGTSDVAFRYAIEDGVGVYYWIDEVCAYALSGQLDRTQMLSIGRVVYAQLAAAETGAPAK